MPAESSKPKCPACRSTRLIEGTRSGQQPSFVPEGQPGWIGYAAKAYVCLDCGFLGHRLDPQDVQFMQAQQQQSGTGER